VPLYWSLWCWCKLVLCYLYVTQFNKTHLLELVFDMCLFHKCTLQATVTQDAIIAQTAVYQMELYQNIFIWSLVGAISDNSCFYRPIFGFGHIAILSRLIRCKARYCFRWRMLILKVTSLIAIGRYLNVTKGCGQDRLFLTMICLWTLCYISSQI
jgi:hypothetical protein